MSETESPKIWVLVDERRGTANQALGVAEALGQLTGVAFEVRDVCHGPLARLPNILLGASRLGMTAETAAALAPPWPDLVIAAGRRAGAVARWIKKQTKGAAKLVQIMHPGAVGAAEYDLIVAPSHDGARGANVMEITGAPHGIGDVALSAASERWRDHFSGFAKPTVGLILGGATIRRPFTAEDGRLLGSVAALAVKQAGGSLVVTSSPRTGEALDGALAGIAAAGIEPALAYRWGGGGDNPYLGFIALCDALIVTGDSVSMLCEACAGSQPVYLYAPPGFVTAKHARLHRELIGGGYVRAFEGRIESWTHAKLNEAGRVAEEIKRRFLS